MDEVETINRRDAVTGLAVLGVLLSALVGTIFYRIVNPLPTAKISLDDLALAPEISSADTAFATQLPALPPVPAAQQDGNVSSATFNKESAPPVGAAASQPTFVAPAQR